MIVFRHRNGSGVFRVFFGVPGSYENSPGEVVGLNGPYGKGEKGLKGWPPHGLVLIGLGGGGAPSFLLFSFPFPSLLRLLLGRAPSSTRKGGILLPVGVGLP